MKIKKSAPSKAKSNKTLPHELFQLKVIFNVLKQRETKMLQNGKTLFEKLSKIKNSDLEKYEPRQTRIKSALELTTSASDLLSMFLGQDECEGSEIFASLAMKSSL